jgi:hypothetical protein
MSILGAAEGRGGATIKIVSSVKGKQAPGTGSLREEEDFHGVVAAKIIAARRAAVIRVMAQEMPEATVGGAAMAKAP